ncbi:MAG TPA: histidine kinase N-terminal 7TM domain-containing protein [Bacillales bacterium]|nr:histidine kinase N-terminal 7TM domain-containing protein [Bacillales bacterium]
MGYNQYLSVLLIAITCCLLYIAYLAWRKRELPVALSLCIGMCAGAFYSFGYAFELISSNLDQIRFWLRIEYIGISIGPYMWFIMVLQYTGHRALLRKWILVLLAAGPVFTLLSEYTNRWHHLFYKTMAISRSEGFPLVSTTPGPFYLLHVLYSYILVVIGMWLLSRMYRRTTGYMKKQVIFMMIGSAGPYVITLVYLSGILGSPIDISPFGFLFSGIFFTWGIYQYQMLKLVPHALNKVFNSMKDAVIVLDLDNSITSFNKSAKQIFRGLNDRKVIGQSVTYVLAAYPELIAAIAQGTSLRQKIKISHDNNIKHYQMHVSEVYGKEPNCIGKMVLLTDITEAVFAEEKLVANAKQLREMNAFKDQLFKVIAHDIRDPLSILVSLMEILREEMETCGDKHEEIAHSMEQQIQKTFSIAEHLLDWFRSQQGGLMFDPIVWRLTEVVQKNIELLHIQSERKRIRIQSEISDDIMIYGDKEMLDLIIRNLLSNAVKFTHEGGRIELKAVQDGDKVIVSIEDTGKGIGPDQVHGLLKGQKFNLTPSMGTAGERGIGIGLTLCKEFVKINGGDLWFESTPEQGSTFYFSIPASEEKPATTRRMNREEAQ